LINLNYTIKKDFNSIYKNIKTIDIQTNIKENTLINGENLIALKSLLKTHKGTIDLIYIDPPFATKNDFKISSDRVSTISSSNSDIIAYRDNLTGEEYLEFLRDRLFLMKELLSEEGSIYLHIDYKIGHYVKIVMDEIFGFENFQNDITRIKCNPKNFKRKAYGNIKDMILFYSKTKNYIWNDIKEPFKEDELKNNFKKIDENGRYYTTIPLHAPGETKNGATGQEWRGMFPPKGRHWRSEPKVLEELEKNGLIEWSKTGNPRKKVYADEKEGKKIQDIWEFKDYQYPKYPTEKNIDLIDRIIKNSSNKNSIVLDCFCGSGTTLISAQNLQRKWIGIDQSEEAIKVVKKRLNVESNINENKDYYYFSIK